MQRGQTWGGEVWGAAWSVPVLVGMLRRGCVVVGMMSGMAWAGAGMVGVGVVGGGKGGGGGACAGSVCGSGSGL